MEPETDSEGASDEGDDFIPSSQIDESESDNSSFKNMYGKDAEFINATNMMQVAKTMNKKFLSK